MGGAGSGNEGRKKFGNKFYTSTGGHQSKIKADTAALQYEKIGITTKVVHQKYELPWPPYDEVMGWVVWIIPAYHRPSKRKRRYREDGSIDGRPRF